VFAEQLHFRADAEDQARGHSPRATGSRCCPRLLPDLLDWLGKCGNQRAELAASLAGRANAPRTPRSERGGPRGGGTMRSIAAAGRIPRAGVHAAGWGAGQPRPPDRAQQIKRAAAAVAVAPRTGHLAASDARRGSTGPAVKRGARVRWWRLASATTRRKMPAPPMLDRALKVGEIGQVAMPIAGRLCARSATPRHPHVGIAQGDRP